MERSTVYILVKKTSFENLKNTSKDLYDLAFGEKIKGGWASVRDCHGKYSEKKDLLTLITIDDMKWCRCYKDVDAIYTYLEQCDYWELLNIREDGCTNFSADDETLGGEGMILGSNAVVDLSNLEFDNQKTELEDLPELVGQIVDQCEDYLDEKEITLVDNTERNEAIESGEDPDGLAQIYGSNYERISDIIRPKIEDLIKKNNKLSPLKAKALAFKVVSEFSKILTETYAVYKDGTKFEDGKKLEPVSLNKLKDKIVQTFSNWHLLEEVQYNYALIEVFDRDITYTQYQTEEDAKKAMEKEYKKILAENNPSESEIGDNWSWCNGDYAYDSRIVKIKEFA